MNTIQQSEGIKNAVEGAGTSFSIHYASESFSEAQNAPMAISAIAVYDLRSDAAMTFGRADVSGDPDQQERAILERFYGFLNSNRDANYFHWNMGTAEFGFEAIAKRYQYLFGTPPAISAPREQYNVDKIIRARYGEDYAPHGRFESVGRLNELDLRGFLPGAQEADSFKRELWGDLVRSTATKAKLIANLARLVANGELRTNSSGGRFAFAGGDLDAANTVIAIGERFAVVQRALRTREQSRPAIEFNDEYDDQYLMRAALALFFDDVRPEDYVPSYAGGRSRVDFLLPDYGLVVELKHTRDGLSDKSLGEQLLVDRERYVHAKSARHLLAVVFDPGRVLSNPAGLEKDLQRDVGSAALAVTVKIFH